MTLIRVSVHELVDTVSSWDAVQPTRHRFGGTEFQINSVEMGHIHDFGLIDIPFTRTIRQHLVDEGKARPHHILPDSGWISFRLKSEHDTEQGLWLLRLAYVHTLLNALCRRQSETISTLDNEQIAVLLADLPMSEHLHKQFTVRLARLSPRT